MDKEKLRKWQLAGFFFSVIIGTLLHFTYQLSGNNSVVGLFSAVNESTWEHLKLLFFPAIIFLIVEYIFIGKDYPNLIFNMALGILIGMFIIVAFFYTYTGITGKDNLLLDIIDFVIGVFVAYFIGYKLTVKSQNKMNLNFIGIVIILIVAICFFIFTKHAPEIPLFMPPET